jgi:hypothetical protein
MIGVVIVVVTDADDINLGDVLDIARLLGVSLRTDELRRGATIREDRIEEDSKTAGELDIEACMT